MKKLMIFLLAMVCIVSMSACAQQSGTASSAAASVSQAAPESAKPSESSAAASETTAASNEEYVFVTAASNLEYFNAHKKGLQDACKDLGVKAAIVGDEKVDALTMVNLLQAAVDKENTAGIVLVGHFPDAYTPVINKAFEKGIGTVLQTVDAPDSKRLCFIGTDYYTYGQQMMDMMAEAIGGKGKVAVSTSMDSGQAAIDNLNGIKDRCKEKYPNIQIAAVLEDKAQTDTAVSVITACLQANPDLAGIMGCQAPSGVAAVTACREAGLLDKVKIVAVDRDEPTLEAIKNGEIYGCMAGKQYAETYYATKFLYDYRHNKLKLSADDAKAGLIGVPQYVDLGSLQIKKDNVDYFIGFKYEYDK